MQYAVTDLKSLKDCTISEIRYNHVRYCTSDLKWYFSYRGGRYSVLKIGDDDVLHEVSSFFPSLSMALEFLNQTI